MKPKAKMEDQEYQRMLELNFRSRRQIPGELDGLHHAHSNGIEIKSHYYYYCYNHQNRYTTGSQLVIVVARHELSSAMKKPPVSSGIVTTALSIISGHCFMAIISCRPTPLLVVKVFPWPGDVEK